MRKISTISIIILLVLVILAIYWLGFKKSVRTTPPSPITTMTQQDSKQVTEKPSADGTVKLTETVQKTPDGNNSYTFVVTTMKDSTTKTIFNSTEIPTTSYLIPDNSWSNDNKPFFIEKVTPNSIQYLVYKVDGSDYQNSGKFLDVGSFWSKTKTNLSIKTVTGWASGDLLIVYTTKPDGTDGPHYWFVISTKSFMLLSS